MQVPANRMQDSVRAPHQNKRLGTSLIEVLVVIVVFSVGILAIIKVFPGGLRIMSNQRDRLVAVQLNKSLLQLENDRAKSLPEQIVPVKYQLVGGIMKVLPDPEKRPSDIGAGATAIDADGLATVNGTVVGNWAMVGGANNLRRVLNETHVVPAPRQVGAEFGGLAFLNYGPAMATTDPTAPGITYAPLIRATTDNLVRKEGDPGSAVVPDYQYYVKDADLATCSFFLPVYTVVANKMSYEIRVQALIHPVSGADRVRDLRFEVELDGVASGLSTFGLEAALISSGAIAGTDHLVNTDLQSIQVVRVFKQITTAFDPAVSYSCKVLNDGFRLGILFNPALKDVTEERASGRVPLVTKISYDVYDWRILKDDFRLPDTLERAQSLSVRSVKRSGIGGVDGKAYNGLGLAVPEWDGAAVVSSNPDFVLVDVETGGVYYPNSYSVDYSNALITFKDSDLGTAGLQMKILMPGATVLSTINASGRSVRALYRANGEWAVQLQRAALTYRQVFEKPGVGEFYLGGSDVTTGGNGTRVYFSWSDLGNTVRLGRVVYTDSLGAKRVLTDQSAVVESVQSDTLGPFIDISSLHVSDITTPSVPSAFDLSDGYGVQGVNGVSVAARTIFSQSGFVLSADATANVTAYSKFKNEYHVVKQTTSVLGGSIGQ